MAVEHQLNPSDLSAEQLDRIAFALIGRLSSLCVADKLLTKDEAATMLKITYRTFERRLSSGHYPARLIHWDKGTMLFLPSELVEFVKQS